jgi:hypothetical protein
MPSVRSSSISTARRRFAAVTVLSVGLLGATAVAAQAHVSVHADSTATGSFSQITFRVPNESPTSGTVKLQVQLPQDDPFPFVSAKPVPGWKVTVKQAPLPEPVEEEGTTITKAARGRGDADRPRRVPGVLHLCRPAAGAQGADAARRPDLLRREGGHVGRADARRR